MVDKDCKYFPCHEGLEDCEFCYCPIYPCKYTEFGKWVGDGYEIFWDCSDCIVFHKKKIVDLIKKEKD